MQEKLENIVNSLKKIASLHKEDLKSTSQMPNWNTTYFQILRLKKIVSNNLLHEIMLVKTEGFKQIFQEMHKELEPMVGPENLTQAQQIYDEIMQNIDEIIINLNNSPENPSPANNSLN